MSEQEQNDMQYAALGKALIPVGKTVKRLDAGFYELAQHGNSYGCAPMKMVSDDLIDIPGTPADDVMVDIAKFLETKDRYQKCGLTHKRGYLFWGPPGTGKTSLTTMLSRRFVRDADGVVFNVPGSAHLSILTNLIRTVEPGRPSMFVMEEADNFINDPTALSILDGEQSLAGAVFVAVTNYKEKMPPRIANRPGRFDRVVYIGAPPLPVQVAYFNRLLTRLDENHAGMAEKLAQALDGVSISMGHLREAFIAHVLMQVPLNEVRARFEAMSDTEGKAPPEWDTPSVRAGECKYCDSPCSPSDDQCTSCRGDNEDDE